MGEDTTYYVAIVIYGLSMFVFLIRMFFKENKQFFEENFNKVMDILGKKIDKGEEQKKSKMKGFTRFNGNNSFTEDYYQDANCWYGLDSQKPIRDHFLFELSRNFKLSEDFETKMWVSNNCLVKMIKGVEIIDDNYDDIQSIEFYDLIDNGIKTTLFCPESNQELTLNAIEFLHFCLFLREEEIKELLQKEMDKENAIKQKQLDEIERKKDIIRDKHNLVTRFMLDQMMNDTAKNFDDLPLLARKDYENYVKIFESIRAEREQKEG